MHLLIAEDEIDLAEALTVSFEKNQFTLMNMQWRRNTTPLFWM